MKTIYNRLRFKKRRKELRRTSTDAEKKLWSILRNRNIQGLKFFQQYSVGGYILDFYCPAKRLAIEADGSQHIGSEYDIVRTEFLNGNDITVLRFWNNDILKNPEGVRMKIIEKIATPPVLLLHQEEVPNPPLS